MLYKIAHTLQSKMPWLWSLVEWGNGVLFKIRYGRKLTEGLSSVLAGYPDVREASEEDVESLAFFFSSQPEEAFRYFKPHGFNGKDLIRLVKNPSFLMFVVEREGKVTGYFFLRSFFIGKAYLGKMVDYRMQGHGIGQKMCSCAMDIASLLGLRMYETISKENLASLCSSQKVLEVRVLEEMSNGYLYIEDVRKRSEI